MRRLLRILAKSGRPLALLAALSMAQTASAGPVLFNPAGTGAAGSPQVAVQTFDELPGNALAQGAQTLISAALAGLANGATATTGPFTLYYQANVSLVDPNGVVITTPGSFFTAVAKFQETATVTGGSSTVSFNLAPNQAGSYFDFFAHTGSGGNNATGTGFANDNGGILIYSATPGTMGTSGNFMNTTSPTMPIENLDQVNHPNGQNNPNGATFGQQTVQGTGSSQLNFMTSYYNTSYFLTNPGTPLAFSTTNTLPFNTVVPAQQFVNLTGAGPGSTFAGYVPPSLGTVNGQSGPDVQFQADGSSSFPNAVPEPASIAMTALGLGGMAFGSFVARRRRAQV